MVRTVLVGVCECICVYVYLCLLVSLSLSLSLAISLSLFPSRRMCSFTFFRFFLSSLEFSFIKIFLTCELCWCVFVVCECVCVAVRISYKCRNLLLLLKAVDTFYSSSTFTLVRSIFFSLSLERPLSPSLSVSVYIFVSECVCILRSPFNRWFSSYKVLLALSSSS